MSDRETKSGPSRREVLATAGVAVLVGLGAAPGPARATAADARAVLDELIGGRKPQQGRVVIELPEIAEKLHADLRSRSIPSFYDAAGSIGRRYRRQDEAGTPWCVTVDGQTSEDGTVTIRDRDTLEQVRVGAEAVPGWIQERLAGESLT